MAAIMGLTQGVLRLPSDVTGLFARLWELPVPRWMENPLADQSARWALDSEGRGIELDRRPARSNRAAT